MPEGPEIRRAADKVARRLVGGALTSIKLPYPPISEFDGVLGDASVESVTSRGKALLMRFDNGLTLYSHSQLYGRWTVNRVTTKVRWNRSLRAEFISKGYAVRLWSATDVEVIPTRDEEATHTSPNWVPTYWTKQQPGCDQEQVREPSVQR